MLPLVSQYMTPLSKLRVLRKLVVNYDIKFVDNWYCFYMFILQERESVNVFFRVFITHCRKRCNIIRGMLVKK